MPLERGRFHPALSNGSELPPSIAKSDRATSIAGVAQIGKRDLSMRASTRQLMIFDNRRGERSIRAAEDFIERERDKVAEPTDESD